MAKRFKHPVTGEAIGLGQHVSWILQKLIRRWPFIIAINLISYTCWIFGGTTILLWWNLIASLMALNIESVVGIAMFEQTQSDAKIIRESLQIVRAVLSMEKDQFQEVKDLMEFIEGEMLKHHTEEFRHHQQEERKVHPSNNVNPSKDSE